jgi:hypothetical protein
MVRCQSTSGTTIRQEEEGAAVDTHPNEILTRAVPLPVSRRGLLAAIGSLALTAAPLVITHDAQARKRKKKSKRNKQSPSGGRRLQTLRFTNATAINVPGSGDKGPANPYPATIEVSGFRNGTITNITVQIDGLHHTALADIDILLAARHLPGLTAFIMSDAAAGSVTAPGVTLVFDDASPVLLPVNGPLTSGTYQPTNIDDGGSDGDVFPAPAPAPNGNSFLSVFRGQHPNGVWELWVLDDTDDDTGKIAGGWSLEITAEVDA